MSGLTKKRNFGMDLLRVVACYMVIQVHTGEFFYIGQGGTILAGDNAFWVNLYNSLFRAAVPLFLIITGFFILPVKDEAGDFFRKRFSRVVIPFVVWCALYAVYQWIMGASDAAGIVRNILHIPLNYGTVVGHLWYVYMLIGIYLFAPVISPFLRTAKRSLVEMYLILWAVTLLLPYIHLASPGVWGECFWNNTPMLYYFSGMLGYAVLGAYIKMYWHEKRAWNIPTGLLLIAVGYTVTFAGFSRRLATAATIPDLELTWGYGTINVAMMALGIVLLFKNIGCDNETTAKVITQMSGLSYGVYLAHIMVLNAGYALLSPFSSNAAVLIPSLALLTFAGTYLIVKILSLLPGKRYIVG